ncbi:hypothetical protein CRH09_36225 [Nocardia terpenica]|uniref:Uncharacterized protein n=1 Tax=Nocardia terpenica TaxID=455432 RepID=A0A291RTI7_9NOCA|nr:hypothetical protein CRH09_36225 [Nocardia terpenica]
MRVRIRRPGGRRRTDSARGGGAGQGARGGAGGRGGIAGRSAPDGDGRGDRGCDESAATRGRSPGGESGGLAAVRPARTRLECPPAATAHRLV